MVFHVGSQMPNFQCDTQYGKLDFYDFAKDHWSILFTHPADFTPICTTEFGMVSKLMHEFEARNCKVIGLSKNSVDSHQAWIEDINETQETTVKFPIIADESSHVCDILGLASKSNEIETRMLFVMNPSYKVTLFMEYPSTTGRNFHEVLRALDSLQLTEHIQVGTPANWKPGEDVLILPSVSTEEAKVLFPQGFTTIKPYLRFTKDPKK